MVLLRYCVTSEWITEPHVEPGYYPSSATLVGANR
jgi:hypothetical protein